MSIPLRLSLFTRSWGWKERLLTRNHRSSSSMKSVEFYEQGQYDGKAREYFYFIDHQGMLFMDDSRMKNFTSCFKDPVFLSFFYRNVKIKDASLIKYNSFPYISLCGIERNYIRCDDLPIVFTHLFDENGEDRLGYGYHTGTKLSVKFRPEKLYVNENGRIYHPTGFVAGRRKVQVGLVRSQIGSDVFSGKFTWSGDRGDVESSKDFSILNAEDKPPVGIRWNSKLILFDNEDVVDLLNKERSLLLYG